MTAPNFSSSLRAAVGGDPLRKLRGVAELLCMETSLEVAQVNYINPVTSEHFELANVGYDLAVAEYYRSSRFTVKCMGFRTQRSRPEDLLSWEDIPGFTESHSASEVLRPSGFNNGMSVLVQDRRGTVVAVCNVNSAGEHIPSETKQIFAALRPTLAALVTDAKRYLDLGLSVRERQILQLVANGLSNREIGENLFLSPRTVSTHVEHLLAKLGVSGRVQAATLATRIGLIPEL